MKKLLILIPLIFSSGCLPLHNMTDTVFRQKSGWNLSGYVIKKKTTKFKVGGISSELLYESAINSGEKRKIEEAINDEKFIIGAMLWKAF